MSQGAVHIICFVLAFVPATFSEPAPNIHGETIQQVAERTGYTAEEIAKYFPPIQEWGKLGLDPKPETIAKSFARERFKAPPAPGIHPRIYFNPEDMPDVRRRLKETQVGRLAMAAIRGRLLQVSPKKQDWEGVPYKPTEADYEHYARLGLHIEPRMGYRGPWVGGWLDALAAGKVPPELEAKWAEIPPESGRQYLMHLLPYEAFRCLIDEDEAGGKRIAAALTTICQRFAQGLKRWTATNDWQRIYWSLSSHSLGLTYDWVHPWMTDEQRATVRKTIADLTRGKYFLGQDHPPAFPGNTSNWNIIHANLLPMVLSIEGEEGYDENVYRRIVEGLRKWVYVATGPDGAPFEGLLKSRYAPHWLVPLAKRGEPFIGSEWSKNFIRKFQLHTMLPWGEGGIFETGIGTSGDVVAFKYAHPTDPVVDIIYASLRKNLFTDEARGQWPNIRTTYAPGWWSLFVSEDPLGAKGADYDFAKAYRAVLRQLQKAEPLSYYSDYRGLMTTRSAWTPDAAMLYFEPRNVPGGHTRASRNEFVFAAHGRVWATRTVAVEDTSRKHSVIMVDGKGQGHQCPQGRTVALADTPEATFCSGDATWAYSFRAGHDDDLPVEVTPNNSRLTPSPLPWMDKPWSFLPAWNTGHRGGGRHGRWARHNPVRYAFRAAGLVRGASPYALIIDDCRKDDETHLYEWQMQLADDVELAAIKRGKDDNDQLLLDLLLKETEGNRRLLVRVLSSGSNRAESAATHEGARLEIYDGGDQRHSLLSKRLVLPLRAVTASFKVMLYPYREGEPLPSSQWDANRTTLTIASGTQTDTFTFRQLEDGRTVFNLKADRGLETKSFRFGDQEDEFEEIEQFE